MRAKILNFCGRKSWRRWILIIISWKLNGIWIFKQIFHGWKYVVMAQSIEVFQLMSEGSVSTTHNPPPRLWTYASHRFWLPPLIEILFLFFWRTCWTMPVKGNIICYYTAFHTQRRYLIRWGTMENKERKTYFKWTKVGRVVGGLHIRNSRAFVRQENWVLVRGEVEMNLCRWEIDPPLIFLKSCK